MRLRSLHVWVTRAEPGASATASRLRERGCKVLVAPLLRIRRLAVAPEDLDRDLDGATAIVFTSTNGVSAFADLSPARNGPVFAVGDTTAQAARDAGFNAVESADGDVKALAALILSRRAGRAGDILYVGAAEPAGDLTGVLAAGGVNLRSRAVYASEPVAPSEETLEGLSDLDLVLVHSPRAGRILAEILAAHPTPTLKALCISPAVAETLTNAGLAQVIAAPFPVESALLDLING